MRNIDRWFILIGLLYGTFGFAFGIWVGINERFDQAHLHAHINLIGFASMVLFGLLYRAFPALAENKLAAVHFILFNLGAVVFLVGIPLAQAHQTVACVQRTRGEGGEPGLTATSVRRRGRWRQGRCARPRPGRAAASGR